MMWWVRQLPSVRALLEELERTEEARLRAEREAEVNAAHVEFYRAQFEKAQEAERRAYQMQINYDVQRKFGVVPFPEAPHLPESLGPQKSHPIEAQYVRPEVLARRRLIEFKKSLIGQISEQVQDVG